MEDREVILFLAHQEPRKVSRKRLVRQKNSSPRQRNRYVEREMIVRRSTTALANRISSWFNRLCTETDVLPVLQYLSSGQSPLVVNRAYYFRFLIANKILFRGMRKHGDLCLIPISWIDTSQPTKLVDTIRRCNHHGRLKLCTISVHRGCIVQQAQICFRSQIYAQKPNNPALSIAALISCIF
jgi:hypothetical protein